MSASLSRPKLRWPLELRLEESKGERFLLVRCPIGISSKPLLLKPALAPLIAEFEGKLSFEQIAQKFEGVGATRDLVHRLASLLDEHLFLATPRFFEAEQSIKQNFLDLPVRPAAFAGLGYSAKREDLEKEVDSYLSSSVGTQNLHVQDASPAKLLPNDLVCLMAPHIDYRRGNSCYGAAYSALIGAHHDLYIVIGTSHQYSRTLFHLTTKNFETPLGTIANDRSFSERLAARYGTARSFEDEFLHRREHSLELQLPFLQRTTSAPAFCPILVGSFHQFLSAQKLPNEFDVYESFAGALAEGIGEELKEGKRVCIIAGVDMAHVGDQFGDNRELTDDWMESVRERDSKYLAAILNLNRLDLFEHVMSDQDERRICGFPTMYTILDVVSRLGIPSVTRALSYQQAVDKAAGCAVTFAGLGIYQAPTT